MDEQLERMFSKRVNYLKEIIDYVWEHRRELVEKQWRAMNNPSEYDKFPCYLDKPFDFIPKRLLKNMNLDEEAEYVINDMFECAAIDRCGLTRSTVLHGIFYAYCSIKNTGCWKKKP